MGRDNRLADGQADAHARGLCREEAIEYVLDMIEGYARPAITQREKKITLFVDPGRNGDFSQCFIAPLDGLYRVDEHVHDHLLELYSVTNQRRQSAGVGTRHSD